MKVNTKKINNIVFFATAILFFIFIFINEKNSRANHRNQVVQHTKVISDALWDLDSDGPESFLEIAARLYDYETCFVFLPNEEKAFLTVKGPEISGLEKLLIQTGLIPKFPLSADVVYKTYTVATLKVIHLHKTIYLYFYVFLFLFLFLLAVRLFIQTIHAKQMLGEKVLERTKALSQSEEKYRELIEGTHDLITTTDKEGKFTFLNNMAENILGVSPEEGIGQSAFEFLHPDDRDHTTQCFYNSIKQKKKTMRINNRQVNRKSGEARTVMWSSTFHYDEFDGLIKITGIGRDITEHKQAEKALRNLQKLMTNIINSMPSLLVAVDSEGKVIQWNQEAEKITGIAFSEARGRFLKDVLPYMAGGMERVFEAIHGGEIQHNAKVFNEIKGQPRFTSTTIYPLSANGVEGAVIRIDDVTEQVQIEEVMIQTEKMLSVGGLAAGMAHEINNPLAGMIQSANVMKSRLKDINMQANLNAAEELGITTEDIKSFMEKRGIFRMIDVIQESGLRAADIVNSMLSFARKSESNRSSHYPDQLMDQIIELAATDYNLKKQYDFKTIEIEKQYADNLPMLPCESAKIQQVLLNILRNGAQAMQTAKIQFPRFIIRIYSEKMPAMVCMEIEDNGPGMDAETRSKVFDPFFTTKPVGVGTGLGLSVSYFIITENHKGTLEVNSEPGKGANFIIRLPINREFLPVPEQYNPL